MKESFLEFAPPSNDIFVDVPSCKSSATWKLLYSLSRVGEHFPSGWKLVAKSRGSLKDSPRNLLVGSCSCKAILEIRTLIQEIRTKIDRDVFVGHYSLFADPDSLIAEGTIQQFLQIAPLMGECVLVSPHRAVFTARGPAQSFSDMITEAPELNTLKLSYRKSGPHAGKPFAVPAILATHLQAARQNKIANRLPAADAELRRSQAILEVLGIDGANHSHIPHMIMNMLSSKLGYNFVEDDEDTRDLEPGKWKPLLQDGIWGGKLVIQCSKFQEVERIFELTHGRGLKLAGIVHTIETTSPTNPFLHGEFLSAAVSSGVFNLK